MNREELNQLADDYYSDSEIILLDPPELDEACIGISSKIIELPEGGGETIAFAVYDEDMLIDILTRQFAENPVDEDDDPRTMAIEWYEFNIAGAYMGKGTPAYLRRADYDMDARSSVIDLSQVDSDE